MNKIIFGLIAVQRISFRVGRFIKTEYLERRVKQTDRRYAIEKDPRCIFTGFNITKDAIVEKNQEYRLIEPRKVLQRRGDMSV